MFASSHSSPDSILPLPHSQPGCGGGGTGGGFLPQPPFLHVRRPPAGAGTVSIPCTLPMVQARSASSAACFQVRDLPNLVEVCPRLSNSLLCYLRSCLGLATSMLVKLSVNLPGAGAWDVLSLFALDTFSISISMCYGNRVGLTLVVLSWCVQLCA